MAWATSGSFSSPCLRAIATTDSRSTAWSTSSGYSTFVGMLRYWSGRVWAAAVMSLRWISSPFTRATTGSAGFTAAAAAGVAGAEAAGGVAFGVVVCVWAQPAASGIAVRVAARVIVALFSRMVCPSWKRPDIGRSSFRPQACAPGHGKCLEISRSAARR